MNSPWSRSVVSRFADRRRPQSQPTSSPRALAPPPNLPTVTFQTSKETYLLSHNRHNADGNRELVIRLEQLLNALVTKSTYIVSESCTAHYIRFESALCVELSAELKRKSAGWAHFSSDIWIMRKLREKILAAKVRLTAKKFCWLQRWLLHNA